MAETHCDKCICHQANITECTHINAEGVGHHLMLPLIETSELLVYEIAAGKTGVLLYLTINLKKKNAL